MSEFVNILDKIMSDVAGFLWGPPLVILLLGGGLFFTAYCKFTPFRYFRHALEILSGKYDKDDDPGQISHFEALSSALASTVGMGNISGVAIAIHTGGPGAIFWMWVTAIIGMSTKFFTCTLAILYRGRDDNGDIQGGPMYYIEQGLGKRFKPLAIFFSFAGMFASFTFFQANQLVQIMRDFVYIPGGIFINNPILGDGITGIIIALIVASVIFGGIQRIAKVASRLVPIMVSLYLFAALIILILNVSLIPNTFLSIIQDAFTGDAVAGGAIGTMIIMGVRRGLFSNEAGAGTEALAHGAAKIKPYYNYIYILVIVIASISTIDIAINFVDSCYALMVIPTMIGTILLSPKVMVASKEYFSKLEL